MRILSTAEMSLNVLLASSDKLRFLLHVKRLDRLTLSRATKQRCSWGTLFGLAAQHQNVLPCHD